MRGHGTVNPQVHLVARLEAVQQFHVSCILAVKGPLDHGQLTRGVGQAGRED